MILFLVDATDVAEGGGVVNSRIQDASEIPNAVRVLCLAEINCYIRVADINCNLLSVKLPRVESKVSTGVGVVLD